MAETGSENVQAAEARRYEQKERMIQIMQDYRSGNPLLVEDAQVKMTHELENFMKSQITKYASTFKSRHGEDLLQECKLAMVANMDRFDPELGTPSTFFAPIFQHVILKYVNSVVNKTTPHYGGFAKKVREAIASLEQKGMEITLSNISIEGNLSFKNAETGLNIVRASSETHYDYPVEIDTREPRYEQDPEASSIEGEAADVWNSVLSRFSEWERFAFQAYYMEDDMSYTKIAKIVGKSVKEVSLAIEKMRRTLKNDSNITEYYGKSKKKQPLITSIPMMVFEDDAIDEAYDLELFDDDEDNEDTIEDIVF